MFTIRLQKHDNQRLEVNDYSPDFYGSRSLKEKYVLSRSL